MSWIRAAAVVVFFAIPASVFAEPKPPEAAAEPAEAKAKEPAVEEPVVARHELSIDGGVLAYESVTGRLTLSDDAGKPRAHFFFVAYNKRLGEGESVADRPVTFVFNGGPGAAAVWLHLGVAGPKVVNLADDGSPLPPPTRLVDNPDTWLGTTDLVFIDPVGTGFSRAAEGVDARQFYGVDEDIRVVAEFIRVYLGKYGRWGSPKFLAGESYGTTRAAGLSEHLLDAHGIALSGVILISSVLDFATLQADELSTLPYALYVPTYAAVAHHHGKLVKELRDQPLDELLPEVERWALTRYLTALTLGDDLPLDQRDEVTATLARYTGLPVEVVRRGRLRVGPGTFMKELLAGDRLIVGRFDARLTGYALEPAQSWPEYDPSLSLYLPVYTTAFNAYVRGELGYKSELKYESLSGDVGPWNFGRDGDGYLNVTGRVRSALAKQPAMKVLIASGRYDLATPYLATDYTVDHLDLSDELRANVMQTYYPAGHMMYHEQASLRQLSEDVAGLVRDAVVAVTPAR